MGKPEEEHQPLPRGGTSADPAQNAEAECRCRCSRIRSLVSIRCVLVLIFSAAVFLSALFWLPPFLRLADRHNLHDGSRYRGHDIVASFTVNKSVSFLEDNILQLTDEIFDEIGAPSTKVVILSLDPLPGRNKTRVVFAFHPDGDFPEMTSAAISLIRSSFTSIIIHQSTLKLTSSVFGDPFFFEVLKFKGGITIIPQQTAFPLQQRQAQFNFTLNFPIYQIQSDFNELTSQLKSGLHLASFENLYMSLSNSEGSTVDAPTVVQSSVLLAIGISPSKQRLKQLAQTIMGPHNLGLNNTEFGRVKQVRLSSILQHSLHGNDGSGSAWSPSPAPLPHPPHHHHHHRHHHHHHHHHHDAHQTPVTSPIPAPAPVPGEGVTPPEFGSPAPSKSVPAPRISPQAQPPSCQFEHRKRSSHHAWKHAHLIPSVAPTIHRHYPAPVASPKPQFEPPARNSRAVPALSPLPNVAFAHAEPPPNSGPAAEPSRMHSHGPSSSTSSAGSLGSVKWTLLMFVVLVLHMQHSTGVCFIGQTN